METRTRDTSNTKSLVQRKASNNISNYLKPKISSTPNSSQANRRPSSINIPNKHTITRSPPLNSHVRKETSSVDPNFQNTTSFHQFKPLPPSNVYTTQVKKLGSSGDRRRSLDFRSTSPSGLDDNIHGKKPVSYSYHNIHSTKQTIIGGRSINYKSSLSLNPRERIIKTIPERLSKIPNTSKTWKKHTPSLYTRAVKKDLPVKALTTCPQAEGFNPKEPTNGMDAVDNLVIEDHEQLNDSINIDEYLKAAESSLFWDNYQQVIVEEQQLVEQRKQVEEEIIIKLEDEEQEREDCANEEEEGTKERLDKQDKGEKNETSMCMTYSTLVMGNNKESAISNDVIEETASRLREQRKNKVKALAAAFETVISLQHSSPR